MRPGLFIDDWSTQRKPLTWPNSLRNFIIQYCIEYTSPWVGFKLTTLEVMVTHFIGSCTSNYRTSPPRRLHNLAKHDYIPVISLSRVVFVGLKECLYLSVSYYVNPWISKNTPEKWRGQSTMDNPETQSNMQHNISALACVRQSSIRCRFYISIRYLSLRWRYKGWRCKYWWTA